MFNLGVFFVQIFDYTNLQDSRISTKPYGKTFHKILDTLYN